MAASPAPEPTAKQLQYRRKMSRSQLYAQPIRARHVLIWRKLSKAGRNCPSRLKPRCWRLSAHIGMGGRVKRDKRHASRLATSLRHRPRCKRALGGSLR
jgi:hypothetical protein